LCDRLESIREAGASLVVVGSGTPEQAAWFREDRNVPVPVLTDPAREVFRAIGAPRSRRSSLHPATFLRAWNALRRGYRQAGTLGDPYQQGAVWIVRPGGRVVYRATSRWAGDHPDPDEVVAALRARTR